MFSTFTCAECGKRTASSTTTPVGAGHARPARFPPPPVTALHTPSHPYIVGRGLDPSACPFPAGTRSPFRHPVGAGHARPATSPPPAVNLPPLTHSPKPPDPATRFPSATPQFVPTNRRHPNIHLAQTSPSNFVEKIKKNLQKPVDKGHTTCYNNQAVSRAQPAVAAAGAFTYSLYAVF